MSDTNRSTTQIDLGQIWAKVEANREASKALRRLERDGFPLATIAVMPGSWTGLIARFPYLSNDPASSRMIEVPKSTREVIRFLIEIADALESEHRVIEARDEKGVIYTNVGVAKYYPAFRRLAEDLNKISKTRWVLTDHNAQGNLIASLRWEINERTGKPHDAELFYLLRAACQAAGRRFPLSSILPTAKDAIRKSLNHEMATRKTGRRKLLNRQK